MKNIRNRLGTGNSQIKQRLGMKPQNQVPVQLNVVNPQNQKGNKEFPLKGGDARFRLIQKKRQKIADARDVLAENAKHEDARQRLNKLKTRNNPRGQANGAQKSLGAPVPLMQQIIQLPSKTISQNPLMRNEKTVMQKVLNMRTIPGVKKNTMGVSGLGRTMLTGGSLTRTVNRAPKPVVNHVVRATPRAQPRPQPTLVNSERYHPLPSNPNVVTIRNEKVVKPIAGASIQRSSQPKLKAKRTLQPPSTKGPYTARRIPDRPLMKTFKGNVWEPQNFTMPAQQEIRPTRLKITADNYMNYGGPMYEEEPYRSYSPPQRIPAPKRPYDSYDFLPQAKKPSVLSSHIISRLDAPQRSPSQDYKVMVTNLHPIVTRDDVKELFQNIGPIKEARMVRDGIAEVLFINEEDAYRSVEVYHNRQLDGQAMNVSVVMKKAIPAQQSFSSPPSRYAPSQESRYLRPGLPLDPAGSRKPANMGNMYHSPILNDGPMNTKSVLRTAGNNTYGNMPWRSFLMGTAHSPFGSTQGSYNSTLSQMVNKRNSKIDVAPDIGTIHHALFSGRNSNSDPNLQVYIKLPKPPLRANK